MAINKTFAAVFISAINDVKNPTPGARQGKVVVYTQGVNSEYIGTGGQSAAKAALNIAPTTTERNYAGERKFSEFYSMDELSQANDGAGLAIGDTVPGVCISSLSSRLPFFEGQQPYARTGLYYSPLIEAGDQPNDRLVDNTHLEHNVAAALKATSLEKQQTPAEIHDDIQAVG